MKLGEATTDADRIVEAALVAARAGSSWIARVRLLGVRAEFTPPAS